MGETVMPEELPHVGPVLLLTMSVVVLPVSPTARPGQLHRPSRQMPVQRPVKKLSAIVGMEVFQDLRHGGFQSPQLDQHRLATLVPNGTVLGAATKSSVNVRELT